MEKNGFLVISLDFELLWGVFDVIDFKEKFQYFKNTREVIPEILILFKKNGIHATWATVGMLFNENWDEWLANIPQVVPDYNNPNLSSYIFGKKIISTETEKLCFAPEIIKNILQFSGQEIGTHTYSHYYCQEPAKLNDSFRYDLTKVIELSQKRDISIKSLVFPRNQINPKYLEICSSLGIANVRSNPESWYWKNSKANDLLTKLGRTGDAYLPIGIKSYSINEKFLKSNKPLQQKASRFLRPVEKNPLLRKFKLERILLEMKRAAKNNEVYHLWWHPHNYGSNPIESINDLKVILGTFKDLKNKYNFQSLNMEEIGLRF